MRRRLHDFLARRGSHDLRPQPSLLRADPPSPANTADVDPRLLVLFAEPDGFKSWPELIAWLERRAAELRTERAKLQAQLTAAQAFVRFKP